MLAMPDEKFLDTSGMEPPEPFVRALAILAELKSGEYLHMAIARIPYPLFDYCNQHSLEYRVKLGEAANYDIYIWNRQDAEIVGEPFESES